MHSTNWGTEALIFGSLIILPSGVLESSPNSDNSSCTLYSGFKTSLNWHRIRPATEISLFSTTIWNVLAKRYMIGRREYVARFGASSVCV